MNKILNLSVSVILCGILVFFASCKKDSESSEPIVSGQIKLENVTYDISVVSVQTIATGDESIAHISLISASVSGKIITVQLGCFYPSSGGISGTYNLQNDDNDVRYLDSWMSNYSVTEGTVSIEMYNNLQSGTATIKDNGNSNFDISFKIQPSAGSEIEGTYSGVVVKQSVAS